MFVVVSRWFYSVIFNMASSFSFSIFNNLQSAFKIDLIAAIRFDFNIQYLNFCLNLCFIDRSKSPEVMSLLTCYAKFNRKKERHSEKHLHSHERFVFIINTLPLWSKQCECMTTKANHDTTFDSIGFAPVPFWFELHSTNISTPKHSPYFKSDELKIAQFCVIDIGVWCSPWELHFHINPQKRKFSAHLNTNKYLK